MSEVKKVVLACRGSSHPAEDQPGDQLLQGQEPVASEPRGS